LALVLMTLPAVLLKVGPLTAEGLEQVGRVLAVGR